MDSCQEEHSDSIGVQKKLRKNWYRKRFHQTVSNQWKAEFSVMKWWSVWWKLVKRLVEKSVTDVVTQVHWPCWQVASLWSESCELQLHFLPLSGITGFSQMYHKLLKKTLKHCGGIWSHQFTIYLVLITGPRKKTMHQFKSLSTLIHGWDSTKYQLYCSQHRQRISVWLKMCGQC